MEDMVPEDKLRACANCARAKTKCIRPDNDTGTCQRLVLEQKLDNIMALLTRDGEKPPGKDRVTERVPFPSQAPASVTHPPTPDHPQAQTLYRTLSTSSSPRPICIFPGFEISLSDADQILQEYRTTMLPEFPFVPVSPGSFSDMANERPFLAKVIIYVCRPPPGSLVEFENWFRQHVSHEAVVLVNKSLELVQAILVFLAWYDATIFLSLV
ncbi:uncharacterized protein N7500_008166 [Penicillium coprophilum]|uniref:uncharacterized protein n=1 Tax=Penicillium coprophilum TaxID=36646 RepID=UPI00239ADE56|nr:uncharacterized protein N7500_008166 [Penicillium coprophilum]KAJ5158515.1 hypothetical protein N7500_008166 [Penicillium coprophilum]